MVMHGRHILKAWSTTQATVALSSGEAELHGVVKTASILLGFVSLAKDMGMEMSAVVHTDASAAIGMANRRGLGKTRHVDVAILWVQERLDGHSIRPPAQRRSARSPCISADPAQQGKQCV